MKISHRRLLDFISTDLKSERISEYLTDIGLEVEGVNKFESIKGSLEGIVVGKVLSCEQHPNADRLKNTTVDVGNGNILNIVCGAPNVAVGQTVPVAVVGTKIYSKDGSFFEIKEAKIRGEKSQGMICAEDELGLSENHGGIMVLDDSFIVGSPLADYFTVTSDTVYEIGLTPNRTDAMSHYGVARDLHAFLATNSIPSEFNKVSSVKPSLEVNHGFNIHVEDHQLVPRYTSAVIDNAKISESPAWLKDSLKAIGLNPVNNVVDVTNYILHGYGQPLHAFDADKISSKTIVVGTSPVGTKFTTLDGCERSLNGSEIMIKDGAGTPLCMAGIFGGIESAVSGATTSIFLESAYFNPVAIRKAAKHHGLNTDASFRFERGADPNMTPVALQKAVELIEELTGGKLHGAISDFYPEKIKPHYVVLRYSKLDQLLGTKIHREKVKEILKSLEIEILNEIANGLELSVPPYRADVTREIDVIEEVLRVYGYNKIEAPAKISFTPAKLLADDKDSLENGWARTLQSLGFNEVMNNSLTSVQEEGVAVKLLNPLSGELSAMRTSMMGGLLENAAYNINRKSQDLKFFEFGKVYFKKEKYEECRQLALMVSGLNYKQNWKQPSSAADFFILKSYVAILLEKIGIQPNENAFQSEDFSEGIEMSVNGITVAKLGKISPKKLKKYDIGQDVFYAEIEAEACLELKSKSNFKFKEIPKFNVIRRDLALLVDKNVAYADLLRLARKNPSPLIKNINLFDVYEGNNLSEGKKSYAMSFELLNEEKTLEEKEISMVMNELIASFRKEFNAELR